MKRPSTSLTIEDNTKGRWTFQSHVSTSVDMKEDMGFVKIQLMRISVNSYCKDMLYYSTEKTLNSRYVDAAFTLP